jgi:predicted DsbA family dithiol-disulfide isomerase
VRWDAVAVRRYTATKVAEAGLDPAVTARLPDPDADSGGIAARSAHARPRGVVAVPALVIARHHALSAAQPAGPWHPVIRDIMEKTGR